MSAGDKLANGISFRQMYCYISYKEEKSGSQSEVLVKFLVE